MQRVPFLPFEMRVPFYCGVITSGIIYLLSEISLNGVPEAIQILIEIFSVLFLTVTPLLLIPAIQLHSWSLAAKALWLGPLLLLTHAVLSIFFTVDNRISSELPDLIPGGVSEMNPGGWIENLFPNFAIYIALVTFALRRNYRDTRISGLSYVARVLIGGAVLLTVLYFEINLTTFYWSDSLSRDQIQRNWAIGSSSWLCATGIYWAFVFGVMPEIRAAPIKSADPQEPRNQEGVSAAVG